MLLVGRSWHCESKMTLLFTMQEQCDHIGLHYWTIAKAPCMFSIKLQDLCNGSTLKPEAS